MIPPILMQGIDVKVEDSPEKRMLLGKRLMHRALQVIEEVAELPLSEQCAIFEMAKTIAVANNHRMGLEEMEGVKKNLETAFAAQLNGRAEPKARSPKWVEEELKKR